MKCGIPTHFISPHAFEAFVNSAHNLFSFLPNSVRAGALPNCGEQDRFPFCLSVVVEVRRILKTFPTQIEVLQYVRIAQLSG